MGSFKTKARTVELLGRKQIRDSVTAIAELMKNAYDADAPSLRVEFNTKSIEPRVVIADSGSGMSRIDIESKWLVLGTSSKTHKRDRQTPSGRPLMGAKGIGRLAASAVGRQLWMFTKTADSLWNIVYIHWSLFENPNMAIHEILVPTRFNVSKNELLLRFDSIVKEMTEELKKNLENDAWKTAPADEIEVVRKLKQQIRTDADNVTISYKHISKFISGYNNGTVLYMERLYDNWDDYLQPVSSETRKDDPMSEKMFNRFAAFVSTLRNAVSPQIPFSVEIYHNNDPWQLDFEFSEEDYKVYDVKVDGTIEHGQFVGTLDARNADPELLRICNKRLNNGLQLTAGITNWQDVDCGKFSIKFCHIAGKQTRSGLSVDDYNRISRKLEVVCGISVYRDGVRILPYGEPENDFLSIEARRTKSIGRFIFSHRNIFGRIDIDSVNNPHLEDKSSREGLIENAYYYYFVKVLENLLVTIALEFLSKERKGSLGIQESYADRNLAAAEERKLRDTIERREKKEAEVNKSEAKRWIKESTVRLESLSAEIESLYKSNGSQIALLSVNDGFNRLNSYIDAIRRDESVLTARILDVRSRKFVIPLQFKHYYNEELLTQIAQQNQLIDRTCTELEKVLARYASTLCNKIQQLIDQWSDEITVLARSSPKSIEDAINQRLQTLITEYRSRLEQISTEAIQNRNHIAVELKSVEDYLHRLHSSHELESTKEWAQAQEMIQQLANLHGIINVIFDNSPEEAVKRSKELIRQIDEMSSELLTITMKLRHLDSETLTGYIETQAKLLDALDPHSSSVSDQQVIGFLRQENVRLESQVEIYSDLANMGLAAEIVNHEFNQLFINVDNAIKNMAPYVKDPTARYWLRQIDMGFRSISDRQNQLSPMYRTYSLRKAKTNLRSFIEEVRRFTEAELKRNGVELINEVPDSVYVTISKSKIFPAISNIINNAIYWVLDQNEKVILIRYDETSHTLFIDDSGCGIIATDKEKIFEPFVSYKPNGRGLGLTVARKVLESQGHSLEIANDFEKVLSGASFKIVLSNDAIGE